MRRIATVIVVVAAAITAASAAAENPGGRITPTSIGAAGLGATASQYRAAFGKALESALPENRRQLMFNERELSVILGRDGKGLALITPAHEFKTAGGVGPCAPIAALKKAYPHRLVPRFAKYTHTLLAYTVGNLTFTVRSNATIGVVMLASPAISVQTAVNAPQCGSGEEGE